MEGGSDTWRRDRADEPVAMASFTSHSTTLAQCRRVYLSEGLAICTGNGKGREGMSFFHYRPR